MGSLAAPGGFLQAGCGVGPNLQTRGKPSPGALLSELKATQVPHRGCFSVAAGMGSGAGRWKQALFLINTDTVTAFLGESKRRGTIGTLFVHGSH